jgi:hypothetical protein|tara:strand:- start:869 stop:1279 length:411 start_codon:yes stop_codon:yes gene_type:complete
MATIKQSNISTEVGSQVSEITNITDMEHTGILDPGITSATSQKLFQIIITNKVSATIFLKIWDRTSVTYTSGSVWDQDPDFVLPCEGNTTADYTFMGEDQYQFTSGIRIGINSSGGTSYVGGSLSTGADVLIFVRT